MTVIDSRPALPRASTRDSRTLLQQSLGTDPQAEEVLARWDRWASDLSAAVAEVYGGTEVIDRLAGLIAAAHHARPRRLRDRDRARLLRPDWFQESDMIGYAAYTDRFAGTLRGVAERIDYLNDLGVTYLHLMPLLQTREGPSDGGYAVTDYGAVRADLGTMADLEDLADRLHSFGISLTLDLVLNHVAYEHAWAKAARDGDPRYRAYFWTFEDRALPDAYEATLSDVFPETAPGSFSWDPDLQGWVWTTFHEYQWDLNWTNPDVLVEFARIVLNLANRGVDCLRLDAIAFLWKRLGTNCQNQPEVHAITQILRSVARIAAPSLIFKAEAIVAPSDVVEYLGRGPRAGRVSDMAYHNSLMVQIWSALATRDARLMATSLSRMPAVPTTTAWATYLRCHDDIGWAIEDGDAAASGWDGWAHRSFLSDFYTGRYEASFADGLTFSPNPLTGDRRVSGTAASLTGIARSDEQWSVQRLLLAYAMVLGFGGVPVIHMGDEIALLNDRDYADEPGHADDNRWAHRPRMPWGEPLGPRAQQVLRGLRDLITVRKQTPSLHASVRTTVHTTSMDSVVCFVRRHPAGDMLQVYNVADNPVSVPEWEIRALLTGASRDLLSGESLHVEGGTVRLAPYSVRWLTSA